jgi:hypothetical protein
VELIAALQLLDGLRPLLPSTGSRQVEHAAAPNATSVPKSFQSNCRIAGNSFFFAISYNKEHVSQVSSNSKSPSVFNQNFLNFNS